MIQSVCFKFKMETLSIFDRVITFNYSSMQKYLAETSFNVIDYSVRFQVILILFQLDQKKSDK